MSLTTRNTPSSAGASFNRIDFIPSLRAGAAWVLWLMLAMASILLAELPALLECLLAILVAGAGGLALWRFVFLRGSRALRALEWPVSEGTFHVCIGVPGRRLPAVPEGCRRYGPLWLLRFETAEGVAQLLVDARCQDARALRRLGRRLFDASASGDAAFPVGRQGPDTIRPKV